MFKFISVLLLSLITTDTWAVPSGGDLLKACNASLANGFEGVNGTMCKWYITPCDCETGGQTLPEICLPEPVSTEILAKAVITGLSEHPELQRQDAAFAAAAVLSEIYSCSD